MFDKRRIRKHGTQAKAEVLSVEQRSKITSNELRDYDHVVAVRATERDPFEAKIRDKFWIAGLRPKKGDILNVRYDPKSLETVFDLEGDPRYDVDALEAKNEATRADMPEWVRDGSGVPPTPMPGMFPTATSAATDPLARLERLVRLRDAGALSQDEFEAEKAKIMGDG